MRFLSSLCFLEVFLTNFVSSSNFIFARNLAACPTNSIMDESGKYCCPAACGKCGGINCHFRPGGGSACCTSSIKVTCGNPPCLATGNPTAPIPPSSLCPSNGILDFSRTKCCSQMCGKCGGAGCSGRPGGASKCCTSEIKAPCSNGILPCIASDGATPTQPSMPPTRPSNPGICPSGGILDGSGTKCCSASCGSCGGSGCHLRPGGSLACCLGSITASCSQGNLPCLLSGGVPEPTKPTDPNPPAAERQCPANSILDSTGKVCCPASCGTCGGAGCNNRPGGSDACCTSKVTNSCDGSSNLPCLWGASGTPMPPLSTPLPSPSNSQTDKSCVNGIKATYYDTCAVAVCCPKSCGKCDTSKDCNRTDGCCAKQIVESAKIAGSDVDISCRSKGAPCIIPPQEDHCSSNPCRSGARCGIAYESVEGKCWTHPVCTCLEIGLYVGKFCEKKCLGTEIPCGKSQPGYLSTVTFANFDCCGVNQVCKRSDTKSGYITRCESAL